MAFEKNGNGMEYEAGAPKKADVLIRSTQHIALKQEELSEQTKLAISRIDEAIELFSKSNQDSSYVVKQSGEIFTQLQSENSALKQELLYLAKQSENIYAGLAEKITELSEQSKTRDDAMTGLADKVNDVATITRENEKVYMNIVDRISELAEQTKRNEKAFEELAEKLDAITEHNKKNEKAYGELSDKIVVTEKTESVQYDNSGILDKLNYISEQMRRAEGAHSMLADKFEILSMRVEQFGFESAKGSPVPYPQHTVTPVTIPAPVQTVVKEEIDYDKLAEKVAALVSAREVISPDYIASKVAEQIVVPEIDSANVKFKVDTHEIARQVADMINAGGVNTVREVPVTPAVATATLNLDEEGLAERIAQKLGNIKIDETAASVAVDIDEELLAEKIASKVGGFNVGAIAPAGAVNINEDELADAIALKVGSLKAEDFEILVDDDGCTSISKQIVDHLDYNTISNLVADKLRDALDLVADNAPDYEEIAERISEKITVAGINEDAIADKAAAALSNYLPEFDTDEIADKVTGAVIDVVSAIPQPHIDNETICNTISERLIESQEDHDYDIVIDDEGISKITGLVSEEIERETGARFDKVEQQIIKLTELLTEKEEVENAEVEAEAVETAESTEAAAIEDYDKITELMAAEIEKGTASRFDKVEEEIAKLSELVSGVIVDGDYEEEYQEEYDGHEDYSALSEVVAAEIEKGVASRFDSVEQNIAKLTELMTAEEEEYVEEGEETETDEATEDSEEYIEEDYTAISEAVAEAVAAEIEKGVTSRLDSVEQNIAKLTELMTYEEEEGEEYVEEEEGEQTVDAEEEDYTAISEAVAAEVEKGVSSRLDSVEQSVASRLDGVEDAIAQIKELVINSAATHVVTETEEGEKTTADYSALPVIVTAAIEQSVASRLDSLEENIAKLTEMVESGAANSNGAEVASRLESVESGIANITEILETGVATEVVTQKYEEDYSAMSEVVAAEIDKGVASRLDSMEENVAKIKEIIASNADNRAIAESVNNSSEVDYSALSEVVAAEIERGMKNRFDKVEDDIAKINELVAEGNSADARFDKLEDDIAKINELVSEANNTNARSESNSADSRFDKLEDSIAKINELVSEANNTNARFDKLEDDIAKINERVDGVKEEKDDKRLDKFEEDVAEIKQMLASGALVSAANETAASQAAVVEKPEEEEVEEESIVTVSDLVPPVQTKEKFDDFEEFEEDEEEEDDDDDFSLDAIDMDAFNDDELMPGDLSDYAGGVDFANMMKFKRSFIARIIQSNDDYKRYYGEVKHVLLSYKKVNSNVAWGAERFNKGRETIARMKIRGKTLCLYLALDPNNYKTSVYHHLDVSDNKSVEGTPMMVKIKSNLGVKKATRLIDEMLAMRNGEKKDIPERDYAAMYPYETIEELIEDGLVKDVRKK